MIVGVRRALAGLAAGIVVSLGVFPVLPAYADTPTPTPTPVAASATPSASTGPDVDASDVAPDNSRQAWALGGAGAVALVAAAVVFLRKR